MRRFSLLLLYPRAGALPGLMTTPTHLNLRHCEGQFARGHFASETRSRAESRKGPRIAAPAVSQLLNAANVASDFGVKSSLWQLFIEVPNEVRALDKKIPRGIGEPACSRGNLVRALVHPTDRKLARRVREGGLGRYRREGVMIAVTIIAEINELGTALSHSHPWMPSNRSIVP